jgi:hypothetical protein
VARLERIAAFHYEGESVHPRTGRTSRHDKVWIGAVIDFEDGRGQYLSFWGSRIPSNPNVLQRSVAAPDTLDHAIDQCNAMIMRKAREGYTGVPWTAPRFGVYVTVNALQQEVERIVPSSRTAPPPPAPEPPPPAAVAIARPDPMPYSAALAEQGCEGRQRHQHCRLYDLPTASGTVRRHVQPRKVVGGYIDGPAFACEGCHPPKVAPAPSSVSAPTPPPAPSPTIHPDPNDDAPVLRRARRLDF